MITDERTDSRLYERDREMQEYHDSPAYIEDQTEKLYLPAYLRPSVRKPANRPPSPRTLAKSACIALALVGLVLINASQHVYSTPDSLGIAYNDLGGIDIIAPGYQPAPFVCRNGPLADLLPWFDVDC